MAFLHSLVLTRGMSLVCRAYDMASICHEILPVISQLVTRALLLSSRAHDMGNSDNDLSVSNTSLLVSLMLPSCPLWLSFGHFS